MEVRTCTRCESMIEPDHPHGLCPACLLREGMSHTTGGDDDCAACGSTLETDARFCARCGSPAGRAVPGEERDTLREALQNKLRGQYRLGRLLGRGGMGAVYLARDLSLDRDVAIKVIRGADDTRQMHERFRREARTAARLSHPNIVPLHSFGEVERMPFFVMGYVSGESLADRLRRDGRLPEDDARRIIAEIAGALDHAHRQGVIHRDVKPDNVLIEDQSGRVLLTDFGIARGLGQGETMTKLGTVVGTPHYMSPEQASGRVDLDGRSDIYSLGIMGYVMLTGRLPFQGNSAADILTKHLTQQPPPLRSLDPVISDSTIDLIERCLAKDPAERWQDARAIATALGTSETSELPDALQSIDGRGVIGLFVVAPLLLVIRFFVPTPVFVANTMIFAGVYAYLLWSLKREGFSVDHAQRIIWREPSWWLWWYPRRLRRPGNVLDRLPAPIRQLRMWFPLFAAFVVTLLFGDFPNLARSPLAFIYKVGGLAIMIAIWLILSARARLALRGSDLDAGDVRRVLVSAPPSRRSFWTRPHIASILKPESTGPDERRSESPHDQLHAILRDAERLSGALRPLGTQAAGAARQLIAAIEASDRQIAELARSIDPGEEEKLIGKIASLAPPPDGEDECAPLRGLLEEQLELIRGLSLRIEAAKDRRNRRFEMLRMLALHIASLRLRTQDGPGEVGTITDDVRAICDEIDRQSAALGETTPPIDARDSQAPTIER